MMIFLDHYQEGFIDIFVYIYENYIKDLKLEKYDEFEMLKQEIVNSCKELEKEDNFNDYLLENKDKMEMFIGLYQKYLNNYLKHLLIVNIDRFHLDFQF